MITQNVNTRGVTIERIYQNFLEGAYIVNRRYQRKLVWSTAEKQGFVDSILKVYPVPLVLLAELSTGSPTVYEIIDGMQRLDAVLSFIEGEYDVDGAYFNLEASAITKLQRDKEKIVQKEPILSREKSTAFISYEVPVTVFRFEDETEIDDIFRKINYNGRHLSKQELRQAGSTCLFAQLIRQIACLTRGDSSLYDTLPLNNMKSISIIDAKSNVPIGIRAESVFWVKHGIITKEQLRESRDEEIIAELLVYMALDSVQPSRSEYLDDYYDFSDIPNNVRYAAVDDAIKKKTLEVLQSQFMYIMGEFNKMLDNTSKAFNKHIKAGSGNPIPRYFHIVFCAFYELLLRRGLKVASYTDLCHTLEGIGEHVMKIGGGSGTWAKEEKSNNIDMVRAVIEKHFVPKDTSDPAIYSWTQNLEVLLSQSYTEQSQFEFKQGLHSLNADNSFNNDLVGKIFKTLTAMANSSKGAVGYIIIGIADNHIDKVHIEQYYGDTSREYFGKFITGINGEVLRNYGGNYDLYQQKLMQYLQSQPISDYNKRQIAQDIKLVNYYDRAVIIIKIVADKQPSHYESKYYIRKMNSNDPVPVPPEEMQYLFGRFS